MKRVEVRLSLQVVAPLLDVMKTAADRLANRLAVPLTHLRIDGDMRDEWAAELRETQNAGVSSLLGMFDSEFFETEMIAFDEQNAESILRACAALRLQLREECLKALGDEALESSDLETDDLDEPVKSVFMCYVFLATLQELIIQHLDSEILDG